MWRHRLCGLIILLLASVAVADDGQKSIQDFTQELQAQTGFYDFYYRPNDGKVFLRINRFAEPFLFQSSLPHGVGSNDIGLDRGQLGATRVVQFERFGDKVLLKQLNTEYRADSDNAAERASIDEAFADSVIAGLPIVASSGEQVLVDYTDFLLSDIHEIGTRLSQRSQGSYKADSKRSGVYLPRSKAFVNNTELEALVTYGGSNPGEYVRQVTPEPNAISVHLHHSLIQLPDDNYQPRAFHPYSGFWKMSYQDYAAPIDQPLEQRFIPRHRLHKQDPNARYSAPVEPIVYYLDPGIPEPVRSALRDGAQWWNRAFEMIGYTDAFQVKDLPADADPMDVRYNVIQWVHRATRGWSYGSSVVDPRTGEIIKGHVTLGSLRVRQDYLIALGLTSPFTSDKASTEAQQQMALARIRQLSAHEVGHTLGIAHNFAASENNRASVMDYPHPYVEVRNGQIVLENAYDAGIAPWDQHVIAYGYQDYPSAQAESTGLQQQLESTRQAGLRYISDPDARALTSASAQGHLWDNGNDPVAELQRVMQVRELALKNMGLNSINSGTALSQLEETLVPIYLFHRYQAEAAAKLIGGVVYEYESKGDYPQPKGVRAVDSTAQIQAFETLLATLETDFLQLPPELLALIPPKAYGERRNRESFAQRTGPTFDPLTAAESSAGFTLTLLLQPQRLNRLSQQQGQDSSKIGVDDLVARLISKTVKSSSNGNLKRRVSHIVVDRLVSLLSDSDLAPEVNSTVYYQLLQLQTWLAQQQQRDAEVMAKRLQVFFDSGEWQGAVAVKPLPPGSPI